MKTENSKTNKPHKFVLSVSVGLDLRSTNKHVSLQKLSIYYEVETKKKTVQKQ